MLASNSKKEGLLRIVNNLLSRCDTVHDFTGERAKKVMSDYTIDNIYQYLNRTADLQDKNIVDEFKKAGIVESRIIDDLKMIMRRKDNPSFNFLQSYKNGVDERSCGYEPSVVQFFEYLLGPYDMLDPFYLLESEEVKKRCLIDYTETNASLVKSMDFILGKICVMELGNVEKMLADDDADEDERGGSAAKRPASGIWLNNATLQQFRNDLTTFFVGTATDRKRLRFVIDASIVSNDTFHDETDDENGIKVALLACSEWDSATKFSKGILVPSQFYTSSSDTSDRVLYGLQSLYAQSSADSLVVMFNQNIVTGLEKIPREVGNIVNTLVEGMRGTGRAPEAFRILNQTIRPITNDKMDLEGVFFDIKRSGDGCQVIQIKQMNSKPDATEKYVLVTNDHLAFLKARLNAVPVVFTKRNTITGNKRLFLINDIEKGSLEDQANNLMGCLKKERDVLQNLLAEINLDDLDDIFDDVIEQFDKLKDDMLVRFFGENKVDDEIFEHMILDAISKNKTTFEFLIERQRTDLHYISMRIKAYLYDFLAISIDLKTRRSMMRRTFAQYQQLVVNADTCLEECDIYLQQPSPAFDKVIRMCRGNLGSFSLIKTRGYGRVLYDWALTDNIRYILQEKMENIRTVLWGDNPVSLITNKHFLLQDSVVVQNALNFKPIKVYNDIWRFLSTSYKSLSLSQIQPRISRRSAKTTVDEIGNPKSGSSVFLAKAKEFIERIYHDYGVGNDIPAELRNLLEEVCGMDEFYKILIMEDTAQNFSLRMVDAGYVSEWLTASSILPHAAGGGGYGYANDMELKEDSDDDENTPETIIYNHPMTVTNQESQFQNDSNSQFQTQYASRKRYGQDIIQSRTPKRRELLVGPYISAFEELHTLLYLDFLESFYGLNQMDVFSNIASYLSLEQSIEAHLKGLQQSPSMFDDRGAEESIELILSSINGEEDAIIAKGGARSACDPSRLNLMADIVKQCRLMTFHKREWRSAVKSSLRILDRNALPHHVSETEWIRFLTKKLTVLPFKDLKQLHMRMSKI